MALFGKRDKIGSDAMEQPAEETSPLPAREVNCGVCRQRTSFSRCWRRHRSMRQCSCCGLIFQNPAELYQKVVPVCPQCREPLEQAGFEYGYCDGCGSKFEIVAGTKPGLMPNQEQRRQMAKFGQVKDVY